MKRKFEINDCVTTNYHGETIYGKITYFWNQYNTTEILLNDNDIKRFNTSYIYAFENNINYYIDLTIIKL